MNAQSKKKKKKTERKMIQLKVILTKKSTSQQIHSIRDLINYLLTIPIPKPNQTVFSFICVELNDNR